MSETTNTSTDETTNKTADMKLYMRGYMKTYKQEHKEYYYGKVKCECGISYSRTNKCQHLRTRLHQIYALKEQVNELERKLNEKNNAEQ